MLSKNQEQLLNNFADNSDVLFNLGVISTDSFTGEIGEYIACSYFKLIKSNRVTRAVDAVSSKGERYQIKSKIVNNNNFSISFNNLENSLFDYLVIVYFDKFYTPLKMVKISADKIINGKISISNTNNLNPLIIDGDKIKIEENIENAIKQFAIAYDKLQESKIIRTRKIVGDIGEFYACLKLNLKLSSNVNEKGIDALSDEGFTFEIKTRRVYESGRRISETRRLNNLVGKSADYLIVVTLDRIFKCSGMWIIPMKNITNAKSANLKIVNNTPGTLNVVSSKISWLNTGLKFNGFK